jgi:hypothetical protein
VADEGLIPPPARIPTVLVLVLVLGCGAPAPAPAGAPAPAPTPQVFEDPAAWPTFHSQRFQLSIPMPDGRGWRIDDHRHVTLVATHAATKSRIAAWAANQADLMNRHKCEDRARELGFVPKGELSTVEDHVETFPEAYDSRIWVAIAARPGQPLVGHVFLFGAFLRRCLFVHFSSEVPSADDEPVLSTRLAAARTRIVGKLTLDPPRVQVDAEVPRDKPSSAP